MINSQLPVWRTENISFSALGRRRALLNSRRGGTFGGLGSLLNVRWGSTLRGGRSLRGLGSLLYGCRSGTLGRRGPLQNVCRGGSTLRRRGPLQNVCGGGSTLGRRGPLLNIHRGCGTL